LTWLHCLVAHILDDVPLPAFFHLWRGSM